MDLETVLRANDKVYSESDYHPRVHGALPGAHELISRLRLDKFSKMLDLRDAHILEFGCGPGWNLAMLPAPRRVGYDVSSAFADRIRETGVEFCSDLSELDGQQFDYLLITHVLEHLIEPAKTLVDMGRFLKPKGAMCVIVPHDPLISKCNPSDRDHHLYSWNVQTLTNLLRACGFEVKMCRSVPRGYERFAANIAARFHLGYGLYRSLLKAMQLMRPIYEVQALVTYPDRML